MVKHEVQEYSYVVFELAHVVSSYLLLYADRWRAIISRSESCRGKRYPTYPSLFSPDFWEWGRRPLSSLCSQNFPKTTRSYFSRTSLGTSKVCTSTPHRADHHDTYHEQLTANLQSSLVWQLSAKSSMVACTCPNPAAGLRCVKLQHRCCVLVGQMKTALLEIRGRGRCRSDRKVF